MGRQQRQPYQAEFIHNNYYANSTADIMYLNSPITGAVIWYPQQNIQIKHE